jgi:hypothetical protein
VSGASADAAPDTVLSEPVISDAIVNSGHDVPMGITRDGVFPATVTGWDDSGLSS